MREEKDVQRFAQAAGFLSSRLRAAAEAACAGLSGSVQEIRLRLDKPLSVCCPGETFYITCDGKLSISPDGNCIVCTSAELENTFHKICDYSVYARQNELNRGFVTLRGGHRAGICGTAVIENGKIINVRQITSINIRIAREHKNCASKLLKTINATEGMLICGAPCSGKTTLLRDVARQISLKENIKTVIIDERGELAGKSGGGFQNDIGMCDVFDGYPKPEAIAQAVRSMSPDVIVCDEIGSAEDMKALALCKNSGVSVIATVHASNQGELLKKQELLDVFRLGIFPKIVYLSGRRNAGKIAAVTDGGETAVDS